MRLQNGSLLLSGWLLTVWLGVTPAVWSQRVQFPTPLAPESGLGTNAPYSVAPTLPQTTVPPPYSPPVRVPIQTPATAFPPPAVTLPSVATPAPALPPGALPPSAPAPATLQGTILPGGGWDPYAAPGGSLGLTPLPPPPPPAGGPLLPGGPPGLFPQSGQPLFNGSSGQLYSTPSGEIGQYQRFFREIAFEDTYLYGSGDRKFQVNTVEARATIQYPFLYNAAPLLVTPGFAVNFLEGPVLANGLPGATYDAYLDTAWQPAITPWVTADLGARVGVYTDFNHFTSESVRIMGRGVAILSIVPDRWQFAFGVVYLDRRDIKLLPVIGVIWNPNELWRLDLVFPRPRATRRLRTIGTTEWALFFEGEYGGGTWTAQRTLGNDQYDYNDIRVGGGLEWESLSGCHGVFEIGYVFDREFRFKTGINTGFHPQDTFMLRAWSRLLMTYFTRAKGCRRFVGRPVVGVGSIRPAARLLQFLTWGLCLGLPWASAEQPTPTATVQPLFFEGPSGPLEADAQQLETVPIPVRRPGEREGIFQSGDLAAVWLPAPAKGDLGWTQLNTRLTFGFPFPVREGPLLVSPFFAAWALDGPDDPDLPSSLYGTGIQFRWLGKLAGRWSYEVAVTPGIYSDMEIDNGDAMRITGRGIAVYEWNAFTKLLLGVVYLDRRDVGVLPVAGLICRPNDDWSIELLFPRPRLARRLAFVSFDGDPIHCCEHWLYLAGEFGGGTWAIERADGGEDELTLRDYRLLIGWERKHPTACDSRIEIGYVFGRDVEFESATPDFEPDDTLLVRYGVKY